MDVAPDEPPSESDPADVTGSESSIRRISDWGKTRATAVQLEAQTRFDASRHRPLVDVGMRFYERDKMTAGSVVSSAVAFRLFLFFVPMLLFVVGLLGFLGRYVGRDEVDDAGITGSLAGQINEALAQPNATRWIATLSGLVGMVVAGRTLSKVMCAASCLSWGLPMQAKASVRTIGATVGLLLGFGVVSAVINKVRYEFGIGIASISFLAAFAIYAVAWLLLSLLLPRATTDPSALLPGALLVGATIAGMQAVSQLYLPNQFEHASEVYGAVGVAVVTLGWFFILGRATVMSLTLNAVIYERFGSISTFTFGLPVIRALPRRYPKIRRFFQLEEPSPTDVGGPPDEH